jgi:hypothetical protein
MAITIDGDNGISGVNGTATTPALQGTDSNTGIVFGTDEVQIATGGSTRATVDSSGRLLIGTSSSQGEWNNSSGDDHIVQIESASSAFSQSWISHSTSTTAGVQLDVGRSRGTSNGSTTVVNSGDLLGHLCFQGADGDEFVRAALIQAHVDGTPGSNDMPGRLTFHTTADGASSPTERLRITSGGKIQVTGTRGGTLQASDNDSLELYTSATSGNANTGGGITFYNNHGNGHVMGGVIHVVKQNGTYENSQSDMLFGTRINGSDVTYRARLTSHGSWETFTKDSVNIDIANTQASGNNEAFIYARYGSTGLSAGTLSFRVYTNGNVQNTNNSYGSISDQNLKENIVDATSQWDDIKALQVRKYNFRENTGHQTHTQLGLIAQEVEAVSPGLVETTPVREGETCQDADGNQLESIKSINYSVLYMKAVKALQEAQTRIETLESQHADLLARVTALEAA